MFKLEAFIDDKKLAKVMTVLDGLVVQLAVVPVRNAKAKNGKVAEEGHPTSARDALREYISKQAAVGAKVFKRKDAINYGMEYGFGRPALSTAMQVLSASKIIRRKGKIQGVYTVPTTGDK